LLPPRFVRWFVFAHFYSSPFPSFRLFRFPTCTHGVTLLVVTLLWDRLFFLPAAGPSPPPIRCCFCRDDGGLVVFFLFRNLAPTPLRFRFFFWQKAPPLSSTKLGNLFFFFFFFDFHHVFSSSCKSLPLLCPLRGELVYSGAGFFPHRLAGFFQGGVFFFFLHVVFFFYRGN